MDKLMDLTHIIRSKNSKVHHVTFDLMFNDERTFERVKESGVLTKKLISDLYKLAEDAVNIIYFPPANSVKITILRKHTSGDLEDSDIYGAQQCAPLEDIQIP